MVQKSPETSYTIQDFLGTHEGGPLPKPVPKKTEPKKTGGLKRFLKTAAVVGGVVGVGVASVIGVNKLMEKAAPAGIQKVHQKVPAFNPLTLQQQADTIAAVLAQKGYTNEQIVQAQRDFMYNIEKSELLKRIPDNAKLSKELNNHILSRLEENLKKPSLSTLNEVLEVSYAQTKGALQGVARHSRVHENQLPLPILNGACVNLHNAWPDSKDQMVLETNLLSAAVDARYRAVAAFFNGYDKTQALQALKVFRAVALEPDLAHAIKKDIKDRPDSARRAARAVEKYMHENIEAKQSPHTALCGAVAFVTGIDKNDTATPPAYIVPAYAAAGEKFNGARTGWVSALKAPEKESSNTGTMIILLGGAVIGGVWGFNALCERKNAAQVAETKKAVQASVKRLEGRL